MLYLALVSRDFKRKAATRYINIHVATLERAAH